jgi:hypothetical protein
MGCTTCCHVSKLGLFQNFQTKKEFKVHHIAGRYLQSTLLANQTIRNIPNLFLQGYDEFQKSFLNSTTTMTVQTSSQMNELRSILDTVLSNIPYDLNGIDAQIKFSTFIYLYSTSHTICRFGSNFCPS